MAEMNEMHWRAVIGLAFGTALGFAGAFGGFTAWAWCAAGGVGKEAE